MLGIAMVVIAVTEPAASKLKELIEKHGTVEDSFLRVYVAGGGCSGMSYGMALDDKVQDGGQVLHDNGAGAGIPSTGRARARRTRPGAATPRPPGGPRLPAPSAVEPIEQRVFHKVE